MKYELHPACAAWPPMPEDALAEMAASIRTNGLRFPITLTPDGLLLDGRCRALACEQIGIEPSTTVYDGDPVEFSHDANRHRRHIDKVERAFACAKLETIRHGGDRKSEKIKKVNTLLKNPAKPRAEIAREFNVGVYDICEARSILEKGSDAVIDLALNQKKITLRAGADYVRATPKADQVPDPEIIRAFRQTRRNQPATSRARPEHGETIDQEVPTPEGPAETGAPIDTAGLPKSSQEKLAALERRLRAQLDSEFDGKVREEVKRRLAQRDAADSEAIDQANELISHSTGRQRPPFNAQEYHTVLWALHPDNNDPAKRTAAFVLMRRKKLILCDEGPIARRSPPLPATLVRVKRGGRA